MQHCRHDTKCHAPNGVHSWEDLIERMAHKYAKCYTVAQLKDILSEENRAIISDQGVAAAYGHSKKATIQKYEPFGEKVTLYHWTMPKSKQNIQKSGIMPMQRRYVHLTTRPYAIRKTKRTAVELNSKRLVAAGLKLLKTNNPEVILCDGIILPHLIKRWIKVQTDEI